MFGGTGMGIFAALHYWLPKMFGRMYNLKRAKVAFWIIFVGFNTLYFPMFIMGWLGMPRRYYDYLPEYTIYHQIATVGSWILITGMIIMFTNLIKGMRKGKIVTERNIWGGETLEWTIETPPTHENFDELPLITGTPYEYKQNDSEEIPEEINH
jgi:cytochrome c oxidase subunit 1